MAGDIYDFLSSDCSLNKPWIPPSIQNVLKIKRLTPTAIIPKYAHPTDSGLDLCYDSGQEKKGLAILPKQRLLVPTGISIELPPNTEAQIRPRSGLAAKYGITVLNTPGTIDEGYRGEIKVILINLGDEWLTLNHGDRIAQMVICPVLRPEIITVDELTDSDRGANGFGSTGVNS